MRQVFWNLLQNAVKFSFEGAQIEVRSWNRDEFVVVEVADNGTGIAPEVLPRLFMPFQQGALNDGAQRSSRSGLGLGLAICKGIVEAHGGRIWIEPAQTVGTTVRFTLPVA